MMTPEEKKALLQGFKMEIRELKDGIYLVMKEVPEWHHDRESLDVGNMLLGDDFVILYKLR